MIDPPPANGLGLTGAMRLERIERQCDKLSEMVGDLGNEVHAALEKLKDQRLYLEALEKRTRSLELKFFGILAGLVTAIAVILWQGGGLPT